MAQADNHSFSPAVGEFSKVGSDPIYRQMNSVEIWKVVTRDKRQLAMKLVKLPCEVNDEEVDELSGEQWTKLVKEVEKLKELRHPNIMRFFGIEDSGQVTFRIFMEFVEGDRVSDLLDREKMEETRIRRIGRDICSALVYLHEKSIVHCDIQGRNVMIDNSSNSAKLIDFGMSVKLSMLGSQVASAKYTASKRGSDAFMSPELLSSDERRYSRESDIWAFGCTIYQMYSRKIPYSEAKNEFQLGSKISRFGAPPLPEWCPGVGKDFYAKCVAREPGDRMTAEQLEKHKFLTGLSVTDE